MFQQSSTSLHAKLVPSSCPSEPYCRQPWPFVGLALCQPYGGLKGRLQERAQTVRDCRPGIFYVNPPDRHNILDQIKKPEILHLEKLASETTVLIPSKLAIGSSDDEMILNVDEGSDSGASTRTLASTVQSYRYENGRRYHAYRDGAYWGPNDEKDIYHQTVTHHLFYLTLDDEMLLAPVSNPQNVLDIGTGVGLWAVNFADAYPEAKVTGTDLSPLWNNPVQPNLRFQVDDCCSEWTYLEEIRERFDTIHIRCLYGSVADWALLYKRCFEHLVPGGFIEQAEMSIIPHSADGTLPRCSIFHQWERFWRQCSVVTGKSWSISETMRESIMDAGFVDVCEKRFRWPIGMWSSDPKLKELGRWYREFWESGMEGWVMALSTRHLGWTVTQAHTFVKETRKALYDRTSRVYFELVVVHGRTPGNFRPDPSRYDHSRSRSYP